MDRILHRTILFCTLFLLACRSLDGSGPFAHEDPSSGLAVQAVTVLPSAMKKGHHGLLPVSLDRPEVEVLQVPPGLVLLGEVMRPRAYLRRGPGTQFEVGDQLLPKGSQVLIQTEVGAWKKVQVLRDGQIGWIHTRALAASKPNETPLRIAFKNLLTVSTMKMVRSGESYPSRERLPLSIPKGTIFTSLRSNREGHLVWLSTTNSVLWLSRKDAQ